MKALGSEPLVLQKLISNLQFLVATDENAYGYDYESEDSVLDGQVMGHFTLLYFARPSYGLLPLLDTQSFHSLTMCNGLTTTREHYLIL
jgi:hypothetical protein